MDIQYEQLLAICLSAAPLFFKEEIRGFRYIGWRIYPFFIKHKTASNYQLHDIEVGRGSLKVKKNIQ